MSFKLGRAYAGLALIFVETVYKDLTKKPATLYLQFTVMLCLTPLSFVVGMCEDRRKLSSVPTPLCKVEHVKEISAPVNTFPFKVVYCILIISIEIHFSHMSFSGNA